ncbi:MAG: ankyrin repeat domain-containing protein [Parachlamydiaceae bacterium]
MKFIVEILHILLITAPVFSTVPAFSAENVSSIKIAADTLLEKAIFNDSVEEIQQAVLNGANVNYINGKPPILLAVLLKKSASVEALINLGANLDVSYEGHRLIHYALKLGDFKSALLLIKAEAPFNESLTSHQNGFIYLVVEGLGNSYTSDLTLEIIRELISQGYPINSKDYRMNLWYAMLGSYRNMDCLQMLIDNGMDVNQKILLPHMGVKKTTFSTPLFRAIDYHNEDAIRILLNSGADIDQKISLSDTGVLYSPLSYALISRPNLVPVLLEYGASL